MGVSDEAEVTCGENKARNCFHQIQQLVRADIHLKLALFRRI